ncbi:hypothetical protein BZG36_01392 [Bifiguratus adelaidae]|uniref:DUF202 domain-containing protein n=1 Tax=Bifiguratus adelaidae TaxID=1938954 RepID=A0A261Y3U5_9FUNG|nr:hypothetical protein BZG36_01392 [Bifiguratus adelaidae]
MNDGFPSRDRHGSRLVKPLFDAAPRRPLFSFFEESLPARTSLFTTTDENEHGEDSTTGIAQGHKKRKVVLKLGSNKSNWQASEEGVDLSTCDTTPPRQRHPLTPIPTVINLDRPEEKVDVPAEEEVWNIDWAAVEENLDLDAELTLATPAVEEIPETQAREDLLDDSPEQGPSPKPETAITDVGASPVPAGLENVFERAIVKEWSEARLKAWSLRHVNAEAFYYRFVDIDEYQSNGKFSKKDHDAFMARLQEFEKNGWTIGASWGIFSMGVPHRAGYQCSAYYRKLIQGGKLKDDAYAMVDGKLKMVNKKHAGSAATGSLSDAWKTERVQAQEKEIEAWIKEYHPTAAIGSVTSYAIHKPAPSKPKTSAKNMLGAMRKLLASTRSPSSPVPEQTMSEEEAFSVTDFEHHANISMLSGTNKARAIVLAQRRYENNLQKYLNFIERDVQGRRWLIRVRMPRKSFIRRQDSLAANEPPTVQSKSPKHLLRAQADLSTFFRGVKARKIDSPDECISFLKITKELWNGVKIMEPLARPLGIEQPKQKTYLEVDRVNDLDSGTLAALLSSMRATQTDQNKAIDFKGVLIDPPWQFYNANPTVNNQCYYSLEMLAGLCDLLHSVVASGLVFVWTHKLCQDGVVEIMHASGFRYVENLVWFKRSLANFDVSHASPTFRSTKEILLIFKKGDEFDLRHQRSADVIIDFPKPVSDWIDHGKEDDEENGEEGWLSDICGIELVVQNMASTARDHFANERNWLSALRLSIGFLTLGFSILLNFRLETPDRSQPKLSYDPFHGKTSHVVGYMMIGIGLLVFAVSTINYFRTQRQLLRRQVEQGYMSGWIAMVLVAGFGILTMGMALRSD